MVSRAFIDGFYMRPRIDMELLSGHHEGLVCLSGCVGGKIPQLILAGSIDEAEAYVYLQHRWEDEKGKIHAIRVGTGYERFSQTQEQWVNAHRVPIHYGDITGEPWYREYMGFKGIERAANSKGKITPIIEEGWDATLDVTHMVIVITSGKMVAFEGHEGNTLWVDNVCLVYED